MGGKPAMWDQRGRLLYQHRGVTFMVTTPLDGEPATLANGGTIGFAMDGPEQAEAWHKAGVENGGTSIEDPPGLRETLSAACTSPIFATRTATSSARSTGYLAERQAIAPINLRQTRGDRRGWLPS